MLRCGSACQTGASASGYETGLISLSVLIPFVDFSSDCVAAAGFPQVDKFIKIVNGLCTGDNIGDHLVCQRVQIAAVLGEGLSGRAGKGTDEIGAAVNLGVQCALRAVRAKDCVQNPSALVVFKAPFSHVSTVPA